MDETLLRLLMQTRSQYCSEMVSAVRFPHIPCVKTHADYPVRLSSIVHRNREKVPDIKWSQHRKKVHKSGVGSPPVLLQMIDVPSIGVRVSRNVVPLGEVFAMNISID
jgi:hypothetical protein